MGADGAKKIRLSEYLSRLPHRWTQASRERWLERCIEAGLDYIAEQRAEVTRLRDRSILFVTFMGAATAFLVASCVAIKDRPWLFYVLAIAGTAGFLVVAYFLVQVTASKRLFRVVLDPQPLSRWMNGSRPEPNFEAAQLRLATNTLPTMISTNEAGLSKIRSAYNGLLWSGLLTMGIWVSVVWVFA